MDSQAEYVEIMEQRTYMSLLIWRTTAGFGGGHTSGEGQCLIAF